MNLHKTSSVLASFATLKSLSEEKKYQNQYQILREFIEYIITVDSLHSFSAIEMKNSLEMHFGFSIPEAVIKTSIKSIKGIMVENGIYAVPMKEMSTDTLFKQKKKQADDYEMKIIQLLCEYISTKTGSLVKEETVMQELVNFLTYDLSQHAGKYSELIGEFILKNENNTELQKGLNNIREGSILYMGLSYNINETGSIKKPLTLYLDTEILFSLVGFNGDIYKQFAKDFYEQVKIANSGGTKKIQLYYFSDVKKEIDEFFCIASEIVEEKRICLFDKPAMKAITDGCKNSSDVEVKKADFYYRLQYEYAITEDPTDNYYDEAYFSTNLESDECDEADKNKKREMAIKLISHINKLRNGNRYHNDIEAEHILVTNTKTTLLISKEQTEKIKNSENLDSVCNFAVSLDRITSLLWYKLGNGFSKVSYPSSVNALLKARTVISSSIAKNAERVFSEVKKEYEEGRITVEQVTYRIISLRNKPILPENLKGDDIDEIMDFSPEYLNRFEEQLKSTSNSLKEKDNIIETITNEAERKIFERDVKIKLQSVRLKSKYDENEKLRCELELYKQKEKEADMKKTIRKNTFKFIWSIASKAIIIIGLTIILAFLKNKFDFEILSYVALIIDLIGIVFTVWVAIKKDWSKYMKSDV